MQVLVFDWGDTVMETYPECTGAMADWPHVAAVKGVAEALEKLSKNYRITIGTNAQNSDAAQIRAALDRVGIGKYFCEIFTYAELQARKPEVAFYRNIESALGVGREAFTMIGDSYTVDVLGAWHAGWRSVWYDPLDIPCEGHLPVHEVQVHEMTHLPARLNERELPSLNTCIEWLQSNQPSSNLLVHVQLVAACAYQMALWLIRNNVEVNPILAHRGGLLHDLAKLWPNKQMDHGMAASRWLMEKGQVELAEIASRHMLFEILNEARSPRTWEEKLVYLADKMVEKNTIVSLDERIAGLRTRYTMDPELLERAYPRLLGLQQEVCVAAGIRAEGLPVKLAKAIYKN